MGSRFGPGEFHPECCLQGLLTIWHQLCVAIITAVENVLLEVVPVCWSLNVTVIAVGYSYYY